MPGKRFGAQVIAGCGDGHKMAKPILAAHEHGEIL